MKPVDFLLGFYLKRVGFRGGGVFFGSFADPDIPLGTDTKKRSKS